MDIFCIRATLRMKSLKRRDVHSADHGIESLFAALYVVSHFGRSLTDSQTARKSTAVTAWCTEAASVHPVLRKVFADYSIHYKIIVFCKNFGLLIGHRHNLRSSDCTRCLVEMIIFICSKQILFARHHTFEIRCKVVIYNRYFFLIFLNWMYIGKIILFTVFSILIIINELHQKLGSKLHRLICFIIDKVFPCSKSLFWVMFICLACDFVIHSFSPSSWFTL